MPANIPPPPAVITAADLAEAIGVTAGLDFQFTDAYGVTYTGTPSHLVLSALARRDRIARLSRGDRTARARVRAIARVLIDWFTCPYVDPQHEADFAALTPIRVCELVAYLAGHGDEDTLGKVGPHALSYYTGHLLYDAVPNPDHPLPRIVDQQRRSLSGTDDSPERPLRVTASAADGADEVPVPLHIEAREDIYWQLTAAVPISVDELNELLMDPRDYLDDYYLSDRRELIEDYLDYCTSQSDEGISITATLAKPTSCPATDEQTGPPAVALELFFVGPDRDAALNLPPFTSRDKAEHFAGGHDRIYTTNVQINAEDLHIRA